MIDPAILAGVERQVSAALATGSHDGLDVIGYGEISTVLKIDTDSGPFAAKRLPAMSAAQFDAYVAILADYVDRLRSRGLEPAQSVVLAVGTDPVVPYCIQPFEPRLLVHELGESDAAGLAHWAGLVVDSVCAAVDDRTGLDGQVSNWAIRGESLVYLDVTTPLMRDEDGTEMLDVDLFIASLPWALRAGVRRFLLGEILSHYYDRRAVLLDAAGNLHKERLLHALGPLLDASNRNVTPTISVEDADRYYRSDARMWGLLQILRKTDRWWQRTVRRRTYPFLLPGKIER